MKDLSKIANKILDQLRHIEDSREAIFVLAAVHAHFYLHCGAATGVEVRTMTEAYIAHVLSIWEELRGGCG